MDSDPADAWVDDLLAQATCAVLIDGQVRGTAWLVSSDGYLLTAGHVLGVDAPREQVEVRFPEDVPREAYKIQWGYQRDMGIDFAVLKLVSPPLERRPLPVSLARFVSGPFSAHGYGLTLHDRSVGKGVFVGTFDPQNSPGNRLFQLRSAELGEGGYSGAAVFSHRLQAVVAIQIEATRAATGAGRDTILAMPLYRIAPQWTLLNRLAVRTSFLPALLKAARRKILLPVVGVTLLALLLWAGGGSVRRSAGESAPSPTATAAAIAVSPTPTPLPTRTPTPL
ncbi:MAG: serine protease, partial [Caldilineae bacterium]